MKCKYWDGCGPDKYRSGSCDAEGKAFTCEACCEPMQLRTGKCTADTATYKCSARAVCALGQWAVGATGETLGKCSACTKCSAPLSPVTNCTTLLDNVCADITPPVVKLTNATITISATPGLLSVLNDFTSSARLATASDWPSADLTSFVARDSPTSPGFISPDPPYLANTTIVGEHKVIYSVMDSALNRAEPVTLTVNIVAAKPAVLLHPPSAAWCSASASTLQQGGTAMGLTPLTSNRAYDWSHAEEHDLWSDMGKSMLDAKRKQGHAEMYLWAVRGNVTGLRDSTSTSTSTSLKRPVGFVDGGIRRVATGLQAVRAQSRSIPPPWRSIRFRPAPRAYDAPPWGCIVRVVSRTKSRKCFTHHPKKITALFREQGYTFKLAWSHRLECGSNVRALPRPRQPRPATVSITVDNNLLSKRAVNSTAGTAHSARKKNGDIFRVGIFLGFVRRSGTTRTEGSHEGASYVRGAKRNRIDHSRAHGLFYRPFSFFRPFLSPPTEPPRWYAWRAVQFHHNGGQVDFTRSPARTPHGAYVW